MVFLYFLSQFKKSRFGFVLYLSVVLMQRLITKTPAAAMTAGVFSDVRFLLVLLCVAAAAAKLFRSRTAAESVRNVFGPG